MTKYLVRLDDACETMDRKKWNRVEEILDTYNVKPMIGVIPKNENESLQIDDIDKYYKECIESWKRKGWELCLHGYNHVYITEQGGMNPIHQRSEFAGLELNKQAHKIKKGIEIFSSMQITPNVFIAPSHTFDLNTIEALKNNSNIKVISDTFSLKPYSKYGMIFLPQQVGRFKPMLGGIWTFCYHPNTMDQCAFIEFEKFIKKYKSRFISYSGLDINKYINRKKGLIDQVLAKVYFVFRNARNKIS